jgi:GTP-binding protein
MIDQELTEAMQQELPVDHQSNGSAVPVLFISAVAGKGISELKDVLWEQMNERSFLNRP